MKLKRSTRRLDNRPHRVVRHRFQYGPNSQRARNRGGHRTQRLARAQSCRTVDVRRKIAVAQLKPSLGIQFTECFETLKRIAFNTPSLSRIRQARERIDNRVQIGRDVQTVHLHVITRVADDADFFGWMHSPQAIEKAGRSHAAGKSDNHKPVMRIPQCFTL